MRRRRECHEFDATHREPARIISARRRPAGEVISRSRLYCQFGHRRRAAYAAFITITSLQRVENAGAAF